MAVTAPEQILSSPYTSDEKQRILDSVVWKQGADTSLILMQIERGAIWCAGLRQAHAERPDRPASKQLEFWHSLHSGLQDVNARLARVLDDSLIYMEIETALASRTAVVDVPETVRQTLLRASEGLGDAEKLVRHTIEFAASEKTTRERKHAPAGRKAAGRRADKALHNFVRLLHRIYCESGENPRPPVTEDHSSGFKGGEIVQLLDACLRPIGLAYSSDGIVSLLRRATGQL